MNVILLVYSIIASDALAVGGPAKKTPAEPVKTYICVGGGTTVARCEDAASWGVVGTTQAECLNNCKRP